jgi:formylglycine-generating enzyme required for sulfatase activity
MLFISMASLYAQNRGGDLEIVAPNGTVVGSFSQAYALVIGESEYTNGWKRLPGVKEDVVAVTKLFQEQGFNVETIEDANGRNLRNGITAFLDKYGYNQDARIVLYFAGHGATINLNGRKMGYIVPVDAPPAGNSGDFLQSVIPMTQFESWARQYSSRHILFIFDSCFAGSVFRSQGSTPPAINRIISQPVRQFITSGDADEEVPDESIFRRELEYALRNGAADMNNDGYVSGTELGLYLIDRVTNYMNGSQNPRIGKLNDTNLDKGDFVFNVRTSSPPGPANMVRIPGGTFTMGSPRTEDYRDRDETQHQVTLDDFYMSVKEVTLKEYLEVMRFNPNGFFQGSNLPVININWYSAVEYCNARSVAEGLNPAYIINYSLKDPNNHSQFDEYKILVTWDKNANGYRLPTEAEWEYACRAGQNSAYSVGPYLSQSDANYSGGIAFPVGSFKPNRFGLYDMHGNVAEWCWDWYGDYNDRAQTNPSGPLSGKFRVARGGSWRNTRLEHLRSAYRTALTPTWYMNMGIRLVRSANNAQQQRTSASNVNYSLINAQRKASNIRWQIGSFSVDENGDDFSHYGTGYERVLSILKNAGIDTSTLRKEYISVDGRRMYRVTIAENLEGTMEILLYHAGFKDAQRLRGT